MKITAISDNHGYMIDFDKSADVLTISGDICPVKESHNSLHQKHWLDEKFIPYLGNLITTGKFKDIVFIMGNHDYIGEVLMKENKEDEFCASLPPHVHYLRDSEVTIDGKRFYGSPWITNLPRWAFNSIDEILNNTYAKITEGIDVLLTHAPPHGHNDVILQPIYESQKELGHLGCKSLTEHIKRAKPVRVLCGHIHSGEHKEESIIYDWNDPSKYSKSYNVSILDERYNIAYNPLVIDI